MLVEKQYCSVDYCENNWLLDGAKTCSLSFQRWNLYNYESLSDDEIKRIKVLEVPKSITNNGTRYKVISFYIESYDKNWDALQKVKYPKGVEWTNWYDSKFNKVTKEEY